MTGYHISKAHDVELLLSNLLGKSVSTTDCEPFQLDKAVSVAVYRDDEGRIHAACACDLPFAAYASAALTMIPVGTAEDTIRTGELTEDERDNLYELMNICVGFFNRGDVPRIRLTELCDHDSVPEEVVPVYDGLQKVDVVAAIDGYGSGRLSLRCA